MPFFDSIRLGGASSADAPFTVDRSLRLNDNDSAYISRTPSTEGNRKEWTLSLWFKRSNLGSNQNLFSTAGSDNTTFFDARFQSDDTLTLGVYTDYVLRTNQVFRDPSAWYHMVIVLDTLQATATNRLKLYINGSEVTSFSLDNRSTLVTINKSLGINSTNSFQIGRHALDGDKYFDGYLAEINLIDGQALTPSSFGETDSTTGQWNPKEYEGTYAKTGSQNDGSTFISGSTASNNLSAANAFNGTPTTSAADAGSMYQTALNGSYTVTLDHAISVSSTLSIQGYFSNANFNTYSSFFVNGSEQTVNNTPVSGTENGTNSGVFVVSFTGTINNFGLQSHPTSITGIAQLIVDGEVLINGFNDNGKNSFYLQFADNSGATATTLGKDTSGQSNNFTPNNLAVSDALKDSPTNNFATMNPLNGHTGISQGNLRFNSYNDSSGPRSVQSSIALPKSGKWYWETRYQEDFLASKYVGLSQIQMSTGYLTVPTVYQDSGNGAIVATGESNVSGGSWYNIGSGNSVIVSVAVDVDNNSVKFYKDNSLQGTIALPTLTSDQEYFFTWANTSGGSSSSLNDTFNFGADSTFQGQETSGGNTDANGIGDFKYAPPSGHLALCSANLPNPTIKLPNKHFDTVTYTGAGSGTQNITSLNFQPDWVWIKGRSSGWHVLVDAIRGVGKILASNETDAEDNSSDAQTAFSAFLSNGFTVGYNTSWYTNGAGSGSSQEQVAWNWNAGDAASKTYKVKVVADSTDYGHGTGSNKYQFFKSDGTTGFGTNGVDLDLEEGGTYIFDWSDSSAQSHPIRFSLTNDGTHSSGTSAGSEYTTGVTKDDSAYKTTITIADGVANLFYYCQNHSGMGAEINTNTTKGSTNFDGSIKTTVKVNATAGFSIVTYTGNATGGATFGHGLGVAPQAVILKRRDSGGSNWYVYQHKVNSGSNPEDYYLELNSNVGQQSSTKMTNGTSPTSTVFTLSNDNDVNASSGTYVAYFFSGVAGYSKFGSYTGNGSSDGTFVFTGFRPAWIMLKRSDTDNNWHIADNKRQNPFNVVTAQIYPNLASAEVAQSDLDIVSNGFKIRNSAAFENASGGKYIYLAFAESPFKNARAR